MLLDTPPELQLAIMVYLEVPDVLALRQTCRACRRITQDPSIWQSILRCQFSRHPIPPSILYSPKYKTNGCAVSSQALLTRYNVQKDPEGLARQTARIAQGWPKPRQTKPVVLPRSSFAPVSGLRVVRDEWLVGLLLPGRVQVWWLGDHSDEGPEQCRRDCRCEFVDATGENEYKSVECSGHSLVRFPDSSISAERNEMERKARGVRLHADVVLREQNWSTFEVGIDEEANNLVLALTRYPRSMSSMICRISLSDGSQHSQEGVVTPNDSIVKSIEPNQSLLLFSRLGTIQLLSYGDKRIRAFSMTHLSRVESFNDAVGVRLLGSYLLVVRAGSAVLMHVQPMASNPTPKHDGYDDSWSEEDAEFWSLDFPNTNFTRVEFSTPVHRTVEGLRGFGEEITVQFLAHDRIYGLYFCQLRIVSLPNLKPDVNFTPLGRHSTAAALSGVLPLTNALHHFMHSSASDCFPLSMTSPNNADEIAERFNPHNRGFINAWALGLQGKRIVWVEKTRGKDGAGIQSIHVWERSAEREEISGTCGGEPLRFLPMDSSSVVYVIRSHNKRDDILYCTLAEYSGEIVLANRFGDIAILPVE